MKVLVVHSDYLEPGGETISAAAEVEVLRAAGHEVETYFRSNQEFSDLGPISQARNLIHNHDAAQEVSDVLGRFRADVVHCNNLFPTLSPSIYGAAARNGAAVVQSLRNYRLSCPAATFFRDGRTCFDCSGKRLAVRGVQHKCYRGSRTASAGVAVSTFIQRSVGMYDRVDAFVVLSHRAKQLLTTARMDPARMYVKYNVVTPEPTTGHGDGGFFLLAGRLTEEKGVRTVLQAAALSGQRVVIAGSGGLEDEVRDAANRGLVEWHPHVRHEHLLTLMGRARAVLAVPTWEEPFGRTVAESFAVGTPVVVTPLGALPELVVSGTSGVTVPAGDPKALAGALTRLSDLPADEYAAMRSAAHLRYLELFAPAANAQRLEEIYDAALAVRRRRSDAQQGSGPAVTAE